METKPLAIYPKDVQRITGKSERTARYIMMTIRQRLGKDKRHLITVPEFCAHTGLPESEVLRRLPDGV